MLPGLKFSKSTNTLRSNFWKNKMKFKNLSSGNHENPFITWKIHNNPCINDDLGLQSSLLRYQGWNFLNFTNTLRSNFWKKLNSKIYPLGINKILLLYHLKQTSWQSMHKWRSFRTSKFTFMPRYQGWIFSKSTNTPRSNFWKK